MNKYYDERVKRYREKVHRLHIDLYLNDIDICNHLAYVRENGGSMQGMIKFLIRKDIEEQKYVKMLKSEKS